MTVEPDGPTPDAPAPDVPTPDGKDWTWVLERPCPECGFDASTVSFDTIPALTLDNADRWVQVLRSAASTTRPAPAVWSPVEYACHVRDVFLLFDTRLGRMLAEDDPQFANWDQDRTAVEERYDLQDPAAVSAELVDAADRISASFAAVTDDQLDRPGRRSDGARFTVRTFGQYFIHDPTHHLWDVGNVGDNTSAGGRTPGGHP